KQRAGGLVRGSRNVDRDAEAFRSGGIRGSDFIGGVLKQFVEIDCSDTGGCAGIDQHGNHRAVHDLAGHPGPGSGRTVKDYDVLASASVKTRCQRGGGEQLDYYDLQWAEYFLLLKRGWNE